MRGEVRVRARPTGSVRQVGVGSARCTRPVVLQTRPQSDTLKTRQAASWTLNNRCSLVPTLGEPKCNGKRLSGTTIVGDQTNLDLISGRFAMCVRVTGRLGPASS